MPSTEDPGSRAATPAPCLALAKWQLVDVCQLEDVRRIEPSRSTVTAQDLGIVPGKASPPVIICIVNGLRVRVSALDHEALRELAVDGRLEGVIVSVQKSLPKQGLSGAEPVLRSVERLPGLTCARE